jgi:hypothetical protein
MSERTCTKCIQPSKAAVWNGDLCPRCGFQNNDESGELQTRESANAHQKNSSKPSIIDTLSALGWFVLVISGLSGIFYIFQDGGGIFGVSLITAGVFQLSIFLGFSAIIDQLYKINVNTSKPDKSDS